MPKKSKRESQKARKKKPSIIENTEIHIVDEGESGIAVTDVIRRKEEEARAQPKSLGAELVGDEWRLSQERIKVRDVSDSLAVNIGSVNLEGGGPSISGNVSKLDTRESFGADLEGDIWELSKDDRIKIREVSESLAVNIGSVNLDVGETLSLANISNLDTRDSFETNSAQGSIHMGSFSRRTTVVSSYSTSTEASVASVSENFSYFSKRDETEEVAEARDSISSLEITEIIEEDEESDLLKIVEKEPEEEGPAKTVENKGNIDKLEIMEVNSEDELSNSPKAKAKQMENQGQTEISINKIEKNCEEEPVTESNEPADQDVNIKKMSTMDTQISNIEEKPKMVKEDSLEEDVFLEELKDEILGDKKEEKDDKQDAFPPKKVSGWESIMIKKDITIGIKATAEVEDKTSVSSEPELEDWRTKLQRIEANHIPLGEHVFRDIFKEVANKALDTETGFGYVSKQEVQPTVKIILKGNSPFLNNEMKTLHFRLASLHLYSQVYQVMSTNQSDLQGKTFYIFRHYLDLPSLTKDQQESLRVVATDKEEDPLTFIKPVYLDQDYVVVEQGNFSWFLVVSEFPNLPIRVNLVPFTPRTGTTTSPSPLFICPLPRGRQHLSKVSEENKGWRKGGYEQPCVIQKGIIYDFLTEGQVNIGKLKLETWGHDTDWVIYRTEEFQQAGNYIQCSLRPEGDTEVVFCGPLSLYDRLKVDVDAPSYQKKTTSWEISRIDQDILADMPSYGKISNLEPFFSFVRSGRLSVAQLADLLSHLGLEDNDLARGRGLVRGEEGNMADMVKQCVQQWKKTNGPRATLAQFLTVLGITDLALSNIVIEIIQNTVNSRCGIPGLCVT